MLCIFRSFGAVERVRSSRVDATKKASGEQKDIAENSGIGLHRRSLTALRCARRERVPAVVEADIWGKYQQGSSMEPECVSTHREDDRRTCTAGILL